MVSPNFGSVTATMARGEILTGVAHVLDHATWFPPHWDGHM